MATMRTMDSHIQDYNDKDNAEIDEVARRRRTKQCWYDEWCYDKEKGARTVPTRWCHGCYNDKAGGDGCYNADTMVP